MIKTFVFDLGNVILPFDFSKCCEKISRVSPYTAQEIYLSGIKSQIVRSYELGLISSAEFYEKICSALYVKISYEDFRAAWNEIFAENMEVSALIKKLKKNYRLLLLSDTNEMHFNYARGVYSVLEEFDDYILSFRTGIMKPDSRVYREVIRRSECLPEEIIYIDDIENYVIAAGKLGIVGIHFISNEQLNNKLIEYVVL